MRLHGLLRSELSVLKMWRTVGYRCTTGLLAFSAILRGTALLVIWLGVGGGAAAVFGAASQVGAPYIGTAKAKTTTWKIQTSWWNGVQGWPYFEKWCKTIIEKSGGELELKPFAGGAAVGTFVIGHVRTHQRILTTSRGSTRDTLVFNRELIRIAVSE